MKGGHENIYKLINSLSIDFSRERAEEMASCLKRAGGQQQNISLPEKILLPPVFLLKSMDTIDPFRDYILIKQTLVGVRTVV